MFKLTTPKTASAVAQVSVRGSFTPARPATSPKGTPRPAAVRLTVEGYDANGVPTALPADMQKTVGVTTDAQSAAFLATVAQPGETLGQILDRATTAYLASVGLS